MKGNVTRTSFGSVFLLHCSSLGTRFVSRTLESYAMERFREINSRIVQVRNNMWSLQQLVREIAIADQEVDMSAQHAVWQLSQKDQQV